MELPVSKASSEETSEGRDVVEARVLKMTIGGDSVSPHQILHAEILEPFVVGEASNGLLQDTLRGGIRFVVIIPRPVPGAGGPPPDVGIRGRAMLRGKKRTIILKDMGIVMSIVARRVRRHVVLLVNDDR